MIFAADGEGSGDMDVDFHFADGIGVGGVEDGVIAASGYMGGSATVFCGFSSATFFPDIDVSVGYGKAGFGGFAIGFINEGTKQYFL